MKVILITMQNTKFIVHVAFWIGCGIFAAYTTTLQFVRYYENEDTPKISYKKLRHSTEEDVYPDITICFNSPVMNSFKAPRGNVYNPIYLQKYHSLNQYQYNDLLIGDPKAWNDVPNATRVADVDFDSAAFYKLDSIFYHVALPEGPSNITRKEVMKKSFQIPGMICFTRNFGSYLKGDIVNSEVFVMKLNPKPIFAKIFVHHPGQTLRSIFGIDRFRRQAFQIMGTEVMLNSSRFFRIKLSQINVLKKRPDAIDPCDPSPSDDKRFWEELFNRIPCVPSYWKWFYPQNSTLKECKNFTQFSELQKFTWSTPIRLQMIETNRILSSLPVPCNEMQVIMTSEVRNLDWKKVRKNYDAELELVYNMQTYQEIRNVRDFGIESTWACVGGYVGLFIGCSLLSLLEGGYDLLMSLFKSNSNSKKPAKHYTKWTTKTKR